MTLAQLGKWLVLFCDEINLPDLDKYGEREGEGGEGGERWDKRGTKKKTGVGEEGEREGGVAEKKKEEGRRRQLYF